MEVGADGNDDELRNVRNTKVWRDARVTGVDSTDGLIAELSAINQPSVSPENTAHRLRVIHHE